MLFMQRFRIAAVAAIAAVASAGPAVGHGYNAGIAEITPRSHNYSGAWPVTISGSQRDNGTGCLTLAGVGPAGSATLAFGSQTYPYGTFIVVNDILVATITEPLYGQNGALMFIVHANRGHIGTGVFENIEGGSNFDYGKLEFGTKNGC